MDSLTSILTPIHREGYRYILMFAAAAFILFFLWEPLGWIGVVLTLWCVYFFRDPERVTPRREGIVVSPADGVISLISNAVPPPELGLDLPPYCEIEPKVGRLIGTHSGRP